MAREKSPLTARNFGRSLAFSERTLFPGAGGLLELVVCYEVSCLPSAPTGSQQGRKKKSQNDAEN